MYNAEDISEIFNPAINVDNLADYDPHNIVHYGIVEAALARFKLVVETIKSFDKFITISSVAASVLCCFGYSFEGTFIIGCNFCGFAFRQNSPMKEQLKVSLQNLLNVYQWATKRGDESTYDPAVVEMIKTLAPYVRNTGKLLYWRSQKANPEFMQTLDTPPHFDFFRRRVATQPHSFHVNPELRNAALDTAAQEIVDNHSMYQLIKSEIVLWLYGLNNLAPEPQQMRM